jgi:hypothetical protein
MVVREHEFLPTGAISGYLVQVQTISLTRRCEDDPTSIGGPNRVAAAVNGEGATFEVGSLRPLFATRVSGSHYPYDVSPDGERFLVNKGDDYPPTPPPIVVVLNWLNGLKR